GCNAGSRRHRLGAASARGAARRRRRRSIRDPPALSARDARRGSGGRHLRRADASSRRGRRRPRAAQRSYRRVATPRCIGRPAHARRGGGARRTRCGGPRCRGARADREWKSGAPCRRAPRARLVRCACGTSGTHARGDTPASAASPGGTTRGGPLVAALAERGDLIRIGTEAVFLPDAVARFADAVVTELAATGTITVARARDLTGSSRKHVLPLLGFLDDRGLTRRSGDDRILVLGPEQARERVATLIDRKKVAP